MPILLQEVRRRPPLRRRRFLGVPPAYLACAALVSGAVAGWLVHSPLGPTLPPARTTTIIVMPPAPGESAAPARQAQPARPVAAAEKTLVPQPQVDRAAVGTIRAPAEPPRPFGEIERIPAEKYTGFRIVSPQQ